MHWLKFCHHYASLVMPNGDSVARFFPSHPQTHDRLFYYPSGYRKPDQTNCTLEVRKVPKEFNNISKLNEHFGKFGTLKNIQVCKKKKE